MPLFSGLFFEGVAEVFDFFKAGLRVLFSTRAKLHSNVTTFHLQRKFKVRALESFKDFVSHALVKDFHDEIASSLYYGGCQFTHWVLFTVGLDKDIIENGRAGSS